MPTFADIIENLTSLSLEEMKEAESILQNVIVEKRREEILINQQESKKLNEDGKLKFYNSSTDLLNALNEE